MGILRGILKFRNLDSSADLNRRLFGLVGAGVYDGPAQGPAPRYGNAQQRVVPVTGSLKVDVLSFVALSADAMIVVHEDPAQRLIVNDTTEPQYVLLRAKYSLTGDPLLQLQILTQSAYAVDPDHISGSYLGQPVDFLIVLAKIVLPSTGLTQVPSSAIYFDENNIINAIGRPILRGYVPALSDLNQMVIDYPNSLVVGDIYLALAESQFYRWDGASWAKISDGALQLELTAHKTTDNPAHPASRISVSAIPGIASTDTQAALAEIYGDVVTVDGNKVAKLGDTMTGTLIVTPSAGTTGLDITTTDNGLILGNGINISSQGGYTISATSSAGTASSFTGGGVSGMGVYATVSGSGTAVYATAGTTGTQGLYASGGASGTGAYFLGGTLAGSAVYLQGNNIAAPAANMTIINGAAGTNGAAPTDGQNGGNTVSITGSQGGKGGDGSGVVPAKDGGSGGTSLSVYGSSGGAGGYSLSSGGDGALGGLGVYVSGGTGGNGGASNGVGGNGGNGNAAVYAVGGYKGFRGLAPVLGTHGLGGVGILTIGGGLSSDGGIGLAAFGPSGVSPPTVDFHSSYPEAQGAAIFAKASDYKGPGIFVQGSLSSGSGSLQSPGVLSRGFSANDGVVGVAEGAVVPNGNYRGGTFVGDGIGSGIYAKGGVSGVGAEIYSGSSTGTALQITGDVNWTNGGRGQFKKTSNSLINASGTTPFVWSSVEKNSGGVTLNSGDIQLTNIGWYILDVTVVWRFDDLGTNDVEWRLYNGASIVGSLRLKTDVGVVGTVMPISRSFIVETISANTNLTCTVEEGAGQNNVYVVGTSGTGATANGCSITVLRIPT